MSGILNRDAWRQFIMKDILLIDKPKGITSFDVIRRLRQELGIRKMGHAGTLDPLASGLMLIGIGKGTKKLSELIGLPKTYTAEVLLGEQRETGDIEGDIVIQKPIPIVSKVKVQEVLDNMIGILPLAVPKYSAIKKDGKPLYAYAREGKEVELPIKDMKVICAELQHAEEDILTIKWSVGSGTYIRSLAEELGRRLGTVATLYNLRRTSVGEYRVEDAESI